jgi:hypothetical protein
VICTIFYGIHSILYPFGRDQGNYAYAAWVWLKGGMLYSDVYTFKPPMTALTHALALALFSETMTSIRILDLVWTFLTALTICYISIYLFKDRLIGIVSGGSYALLYYMLSYWHTAQTDGWVNLFAALAVLVTLKSTQINTSEERKRLMLRLLLVGVLLGVGVLFKYTAAIMVLPVVYAWVFMGKNRQLYFLAVIAGGAVAIMFNFAWLAYEGALPHFMEIQFGFIPSYVSSTGGDQTIFTDLVKLYLKLLHKKILLFGILSVSLGGLLLVIHRLTYAGKTERHGIVLVFLWIAAGMISTIAQGKYFTYHYLMVLAPVSILMGYVIASGVLLLLDKMGTRQAFKKIIPGAVFLMGIFVVNVVHPYAELATSLKHGLKEYWLSRYNLPHDYNVHDIILMSDWLKEKTEPNEKVFVWGYDPTITFLAEREISSRFLYNYPFRVSFKNPNYIDELMGALQSNPPKILVVGSKDETPDVTGNTLDSLALLNKYPRLVQYLNAKYTETETVERYKTYTLTSYSGER